MSLFDWIRAWAFGPGHIDRLQYNPATGLPMFGATDIHGSPLGTDLVAERREEELRDMRERHCEAAEAHDLGSGSPGNDWHHRHREDEQWLEAGNSMDHWHDPSRLDDSW